MNKRKNKEKKRKLRHFRHSKNPPKPTENNAKLQKTARVVTKSIRLLMHACIVGHKDHGKSTLIGRLLYDSKAILEQKLQEIKNELKESGKKEFEFAFLLDSLEEERKGGLTIDIIQTPFKSKNISTQS